MTLLGRLLFGIFAGLLGGAVVSVVSVVTDPSSIPWAAEPQQATQPPLPVWTPAHRSATVTGERITVGVTVVMPENAWVKS
ncbi:hypothetical protein [Streptomyces olivaceus]|uniref:hypothetical protein n=1 Tax=Streptomyces olivaceus TaxID=47716 RepID=UPI00405791C3